MAKQGKCDFCEVRFTWDKEVQLGLTSCPMCQEPLFPTTHILRWQRVHLGIHKPVGLRFEGGLRESEKNGHYYYARDTIRERQLAVPVTVEESQ
jgi:hypothetical protein